MHNDTILDSFTHSSAILVFFFYIISYHIRVPVSCQLKDELGKGINVLFPLEGTHAVSYDETFRNAFSVTVCEACVQLVQF